MVEMPHPPELEATIQRIRALPYFDPDDTYWKARIDTAIRAFHLPTDRDELRAMGEYEHGLATLPILWNRDYWPASNASFIQTATYRKGLGWTMQQIMHCPVALKAAIDVASSWYFKSGDDDQFDYKDAWSSYRSLKARQAEIAERMGPHVCGPECQEVSQAEQRRREEEYRRVHVRPKIRAAYARSKAIQARRQEWIERDAELRRQNAAGPKPRGG